ncbi:tetratricopeptide repeat protein [Streptomyces xylophagus]|uniref:tetratricopeptide repeat protein n=1 Tax=Streptomyces xylophagus TaxID=285514 RepID=UPI00068FF819|nr:tetratricopeptide repeat protein [Streptomyces xylophagus]
MTNSGAVPPDKPDVRDNTFNGPTAIQVGPNTTQRVQFIYQWKPAYRVEGFPAQPRPVFARTLAQQPSRLLRAAHQVVPFSGRRHDLDKLARWRDDPEPGLSIRLVNGPGGQGKTRLASHFVGLSDAEGWTVWQATINETGTDPIATSPPPKTGTGVLLVIDYAERWPIPDLHKLLQEPLLHGAGLPVRILLLARPAGIWWESLETWISDTLDALTVAHPLLPLASDPTARAHSFRQARDRFADYLGLASGHASRIDPPPDLGTNEDYAQILTIHIAALAAVDAHLHHEGAPTNPARASAYLLKRERLHWSALHQRPAQQLSTSPEAMGRTVLTATLTRPLARAHGQTALRWIGLADSTADANTILDDHRYCYPPPHAEPAHTVTVLEPLYPDRLGEDFLGLITPASPNDTGMSHPVPGAITDDWAHQAAERLLFNPTDSNSVAPWTRDALTILIETARRWPHIATGQLYPLLRRHPELALHAGSTALATLASLKTIDPTILEAIEPHLPPGRHTDLDVGIAAITARLARHRLAATDDPATCGRIRDRLAIRQSHAGLRDEAVTTGEAALRAWRDLTRANPANEPDLAASLTNLGGSLSAVGRHDEALTTTEEAVDTYRRLAARNPAAHQSNLAASLINLGVHLSAVGRYDEALTTAQEAVDTYRRLAARNPAAHQSNFASALINLGNWLSAVGREEDALIATQEAVRIRRRLTASNPAAHEPDLAGSLNNLGNRLSAVGRREDALTAAEESVQIQRRLTAINPAAHEPDLGESLTNMGNLLAMVGRLGQALTTSEEAVQIRRRLAASNPAAHEPDLAASLSNLGLRLAEMGRREQALAAEQGALDIRRRLAARNPATHERTLAASLTNLGALLSAVGRREDALNAAEESVRIRRRLTASNPAAHEDDLAASLNNLGIRLWKVGRREEALTATEESVRIRRRLTASTPAAHEPDLADSLTNLGAFLAQVGRHEEALTTGEEAVDVYHRLAAINPGAHEHDVADSLTNLGAFLAQVGRHEEALTTGEEAVRIRRRLTASTPAAHEPDLAGSLNNLGAFLAQVGRHEEALTATEEAVRIRRRLTASTPAAHEPDLADSLTGWARRCAVQQDLPGALRATGEAVEIYRKLMTVAPARFLSPLRSALSLQEDVLLKLGRVQEAQEISAWLTVNASLPGSLK